MSTAMITTTDLAAHRPHTRAAPFRSLLLAALPMLAAVVLSACDEAVSSVPSEAAPKPALTVSLITPQQQEWTERLHASGNIQPWQLVSIGAEISGVRVVEVPVKEGDSVRKGQLLARLDDASVTVELNLQRAVLAEAEANLAQAQLSLERARKLDVSRAISLQDLLQYETAAKTGAAKVAIAQAQVKALELRKRYTRIVAPDDGVIAISSARVGALSEAEGDLFKLIRKGRVEWRAELRPEQQAKLQPGQGVELRDPLGNVVHGSVRQIAPTADLESRISLVYVDVEPSTVIKPGVLVTGDFLVDRRSATTIPRAALVMRDGFNYVMKVDGSDIVKPTKVTVGGRRGNDVELLGGLGPDDRIVASGGAFLDEGDKVRVVQQPGADQPLAATDRP